MLGGCKLVRKAILHSSNIKKHTIKYTELGESRYPTGGLYPPLEV